MTRSPMGVDAELTLRISIAGAQEKTALLKTDDGWHKPTGSSATTDILKPQIGKLPNGIDLSNSVENEFFCLKLLKAFGLPVAETEIVDFGEYRVLVVERFDRRWTKDGRLIRLPQEDCCQALGVPPAIKYQNSGGPGMIDILRLLQGSDEPARDQANFLKAQILFWMIGATDGHAKNFSLALTPGGRFTMTPLYDVISLAPANAAGQIRRKDLRLAMSVGAKNHYRLDEIVPRYFVETADAAGIGKAVVVRAFEEIGDVATEAVAAATAQLDTCSDAGIAGAISGAIADRMAGVLAAGLKV